MKDLLCCLELRIIFIYIIFTCLSMKNLPCWILLLLITLPLSFFSIILCLFMFSNSSIFSYGGSPALSLDAKPILRQFHVFTCASGSLDIVQEVTSKCEKLGILLWLPEALVSITMSNKSHGNLEAGTSSTCGLRAK